MPDRAVLQAFSFTAANDVGVINATAEPVRTYSLQVKGVGAAPTAWSVALQISLDGVNYFTVATHISGTQADGDIVFAVDKAAAYVRAKLVSVTLAPATSITATILAVP